MTVRPDGKDRGRDRRRLGHRRSGRARLRRGRARGSSASTSTKPDRVAAERSARRLRASRRHPRSARGPRRSPSSIARHGVDIVVCTPASTCASRSCKYTDEELARVLDVNIQGNFNVLRAAGRVMTRAEEGQHHPVLVDPIAGRRAGPGGLRRDQGRHRPARADGGGRVRPARRPRQRHRARRDRDAAHRADQGQQGVVRRLRREERLQPLGPARGDRRRRGVPGLGRGQLCDRIGPLRGRRLDSPPTAGSRRRACRFRLQEARRSGEVPSS